MKQSSTVKQIVAIIIISVLLIIIPVLGRNMAVFNSKQNQREDKQQETAIPKGFPYITNFSGEGTQSFPVQSVNRDKDGLMLFLNRRGLFAFNGAKEQLSEFDTQLRAINKPEDHPTVFAAGENNFGYLEKTDYFKYRFIPLLEAGESTLTFDKILFSEKKAWFKSRHAIYCSRIDSPDSVELFYQNDSVSISDAFFLQNNLYIHIINKGIFNLKRHGRGKFFTDGSLLADADIIFSIAYRDKKILGTNDNRLFLFDGESLTPYKTQADDYLKESIISGAADFDLKRFVITTINGGAVIINKKDGSEHSIINFRTGLPDDEIYTAFTDPEKGLWLSHDFGVSRILPDLPVSFYNNFPGREGKIYDINVKDSTLYLATGQGVYYLSEIKNYEEIQELITTQVPQKEERPAEESTSEPDTKTEKIESSEKDETESQKETEKEEPGALKRLWRRISGKDKKKDDKETAEEEKDEKSEQAAEKSEDDPEDTPEEKPISRKRTTVSYKTAVRSKKVYELKSIKHRFKKLENISGKCKQFLPFAKGLITVSNNGLFYLEGTSAKEILADEYIYNSAPVKNGDTLLVLSEKGLYKITHRQGSIKAEQISFDDPGFEPLWVIAGYKEEIILSGINRLSILYGKGEQYINETYSLDTPYPEDIRLERTADSIYILSSEEAYKWNGEILVKAPEMHEFRKGKCEWFFFQNHGLKICENGNTKEFSETESFSQVQKQMLFTEKNISRLYLDPDENLWVIGDFNRIMKAEKSSVLRHFKQLKLKVVEFQGNFINIDTVKNRLKIREDFDSIAVRISAPSYFSREKVRYTYSIDGVSRSTEGNEEGAGFLLNSLPDGKHELTITARDQINRESNQLIYTIDVRPHFYNTIWFYIIILVLFSAAVWFISNRINARKRRMVELHNQELERQVEIRTEEIRNQNKEILERNKKIEQQNQEIKTQSAEIHKQNKEITDSINYAERIQSAALPPEEILGSFFSDHFIFFKPRDIISGDFYWVREFENKIFVAAADCTGHGVPGGFVSMLGISFLNEIIDQPDITTGSVLNRLRDKIIESLHQSKRSKSRDGMDIALVSIDFQSRILEYSGAHNPLILIRNNELYRVKGDRMPIGYSRKKDQGFTTHEVDIRKDDLFYTFSDGFSDQFGGENKRKFTTGRFQNLLYEIHSLSMINQKKALADLFDKWRGNAAQMDDLLVIGLKI